MSLPTDVRIRQVGLYFLPVETRVPLKFGPQVLTHVTCARVSLTVEGADGQGMAEGWGETPLSVQWVWPAELPYDERHQALQDFSSALVEAWASFDVMGPPLEIGHAFQETRLRPLFDEFNQNRLHAMPWLAALVCCSAFDLALHDAYGILHGVPTYETYTEQYLNADLSTYLEAAGTHVSFEGRYPRDFQVRPRPDQLAAWHLVGGLDALGADDLSGDEPNDGYPVTLPNWIHQDGLQCLKIKLRGDDAIWDYERLVRVGEIGLQGGVNWLTTDFNCTVTDPAYVTDILDRLVVEHPRIYGMILYVEQPFPYDLEANAIDVHAVSARKPLFMDESAHDWQLIRLGRELGWTGVALKTCKTQTGAILSQCWARAHGMTLMVQDLTNPMLAQVPHVLLAAYSGTIMGVETNSMQFYPAASAAEAAIHPGLYRRRKGCVDLTTLTGPGLQYGQARAVRELPEPVAASG